MKQKIQDNREAVVITILIGIYGAIALTIIGALTAIVVLPYKIIRKIIAK